MYFNLSTWILVVCNFLAFATTTWGQGQNQTRRNSPYSRYGMGDVFTSMYTPNMGSAGGLSGTYHSLYDINLVNPASLGRLRFTAFEMGVYYQHANLSESTPSIYKKAVSNDGNLGYLSIAFPITKSWNIERDSLRKGLPIQWGMGFAVLPHSTVGYDVAVTRTLDTIGAVKYNYIGQGSRYRLNWANGVRYKDLSIGANLGFIFGKTSNKTVLTFLDSSYNGAFDQEVILAQAAKGIVWDLGIQYQRKFKYKSQNPLKNGKWDWVLGFGAYASGNSHVKTFNQKLTRRYGPFYNTDTIQNVDNVVSSMTLPGKIGGGISFGREYRWQIGLNYEYQWWSQYKNLQNPATLGNAYRISIGAQWLPQPNADKSESYFDKMTYRVGAYYGTDPRLIIGTTETYQLRKYGTTFGLSLPVTSRAYRSFALAHMSFEFGFLGHPNLVKQNFFQFNLGFTIDDDGWFVRPKYR